MAGAPRPCEQILSDLEPAQQEEVLAVCNAMPRAEVKVSVGLRQGKKEVIDVDAPIRAGKDIVTVGVTLCRTYGDDSITVCAVPPCGCVAVVVVVVCMCAWLCVSLCVSLCAAD